MGQITSLFAWKYIWQTAETVDRDGLLRSVGVDPGAPVDPTQMVEAGDYYGFLERIAAVDTASDLSLRTGGSMRCGEYGAFGLAFKSALNLRGSYARAERYARVLTSVSRYAVEDTAEGAYMHLLRDGERRLGLRMSNEASIAAVFALSREVTGQVVTPRAVYFKHTAPADTALHGRFFGCPVHFGTDRDALLWAPETLDLPNRVGDDSISSFFDRHLDGSVAALRAEDQSAPQDSLEARLREDVSAALSEGIPTVSQTARNLGMSARTLQRRLSDRGVSYQSLVDEARRQLAERLLEQTQYSLAEVAYLTGFSEQSAFSRAFKRWRGQTPRAYRLQPS